MTVPFGNSHDSGEVASSRSQETPLSDPTPSETNSDEVLEVDRPSVLEGQSNAEAPPLPTDQMESPTPNSEPVPVHPDDPQSGGGFASSPTGGDHQLDKVLTSTIEALTVEIQRFHERTARHEEIIRQMQSRITELQGDQVQSLLKPILVRFASIHAQAVEAELEAQNADEKSAAKSFAYFADAIDEAFGLFGLESVGARVGGDFDKVRHHALSAVKTSDHSLDKKVQRVIRQGFTDPESTRTTVPAQVIIYKFEESNSTESYENVESRTAEQKHINEGETTL